MIRTERALAQVGDKEALVVDHKIEGELAVLLAENIADRRTSQKSAQLVFYGPHRFEAIALRPLNERALPEIPRERVLDLTDHSVTILLVGEHLVDAQ